MGTREWVLLAIVIVVPLAIAGAVTLWSLEQARYRRKRPGTVRGRPTAGRERSGGTDGGAATGAAPAGDAGDADGDGADGAADSGPSA